MLPLPLGALDGFEDPEFANLLGESCRLGGWRRSPAISAKKDPTLGGQQKWPMMKDWGHSAAKIIVWGSDVRLTAAQDQPRSEQHSTKQGKIWTWTKKRSIHHRNYSRAGKIRESSPLLWGKPFRDLHHDRKDSSVPGPGRSESAADLRIFLKTLNRERMVRI